MSIEKLGQYLGAIEDPRCSGKVITHLGWDWRLWVGPGSGG